jgi:hypothetical protein
MSKIFMLRPPLVAFRQKALLPLDDVLGCLKHTIPN